MPQQFPSLFSFRKPPGFRQFAELMMHRLTASVVDDLDAILGTNTRLSHLRRQELMTMGIAWPHLSSSASSAGFSRLLLGTL